VLWKVDVGLLDFRWFSFLSERTRRHFGHAGYIHWSFPAPTNNRLDKVPVCLLVREAATTGT
jgi:hypothetical protein